MWIKTLTLAITFQPLQIGISYCTYVFLLTRPFTWYHNLWPWPWSLTYFRKTLTLAITFISEEMGLSYFTLHSWWQDLSHGSVILVHSLWQDLSHGTIILVHLSRGLECTIVITLSVVCRRFDFSSETAEPNSTQLDRKQDLNISSTKFLFIGPIREEIGLSCYWYLCSLWRDLWHGTILLTFTLNFDLLLRNLNFGFNSHIKRDRAFIFHT